MEIKRVYVGGAMSNLQFLNHPIFNHAAALLRAKGYDVVNPAEVTGEDPQVVLAMTPEEKRKHWQACMRKDIPAMLTCDTLALLNNWESSEGAREEHRLAKLLGLNIVMVDVLLALPNIWAEEKFFEKDTEATPA